MDENAIVHDNRPRLPVLFDPASGERTVLPREARRKSRRQFLQLMTAVGAGIGLSFADAITSPFIKLASADYYEWWSDCTYDGWVTAEEICYPNTAYFYPDNCWPYEGLTRFHREETTYAQDGNGTQWMYVYTHNPTSCTGRNAWQWWGGAGNPNAAMCSDGSKTRYFWDGYNSWIQYDNEPLFSICRTSLP